MKRLPVRKNAFSVMRNVLLIAGTRYAPEQNGSNVPIIISHGFLSTRKNMAGYAKTLAKWGYTVYTFDFIGGAPKNDSDGTMTEMSVLTEKEDLIAVMNYVHRDGFNSKPILVGFSQGGFVSAMVAAEHRNEVQKLILFYPALCIPDDARRGRMQSFRFDPANVPELISVPGRRMTIGSRYVLDAQPLDAYACISAYHGDVLLLHGTSDRIVDISYSEKACKSFSGRAGLYPIANAGHGFWGNSRKQAMAVVYQFLSGREEVLRVDVSLSEIRKVRNGISSTWTIPFTGSAIHDILFCESTELQLRKLHVFDPFRRG